MHMQKSCGDKFVEELHPHSLSSLMPIAGNPDMLCHALATNLGPQERPNLKPKCSKALRYTTHDEARQRDIVDPTSACGFLAHVVINQGRLLLTYSLQH